jgi:ABC-2 type transport system permease protein
MQRSLQGIGAAVGPYFFIARIRVLMAMAYRFDVFSSIAVQVILMVSTLYIWRTAFQGDDAVSGVTLPQMLAYGVISALLATFWTARVADTIRDRVTQGQISTDLIRPTEPLLLWLAEDVGQSICSLLTKGIPLLICGALLVGAIGPASLEAVLFFLPACVLSYLILWLMTALVGLVAFWTIEFGHLDMVKNALVGVLSGSFVPLWFFPDWFARICAWLPFVYTYQGTLGIYVGKTQGWESAKILGIQLAWVLALGALLVILWKKARRKVLVQGG